MEGHLRVVQQIQQVQGAQSLHAHPVRGRSREAQLCSLRSPEPPSPAHSPGSSHTHRRATSTCTSSRTRGSDFSLCGVVGSQGELGTAGSRYTEELF